MDEGSSSISLEKTRKRRFGRWMVGVYSERKCGLWVGKDCAREGVRVQDRYPSIMNDLGVRVALGGPQEILQGIMYTAPTVIR